MLTEVTLASSASEASQSRTRVSGCCSSGSDGTFVSSTIT